MLFFCNAVLLLRQMLMGHIHIPKSLTFVSSVYRVFSQKSWGSSRCFLAKLRWAFMFFYAQLQFSSWNSVMQAIFAQTLSYGGVMNTDLNWGKWGLQFLRCCYGVFCDLLDKSLHPWSNFGWPAITGKVHHCSMFSPFVDNIFYCGSLESQTLKNDFITFSRLIDLNYFLFCFWIS